MNGRPLTLLVALAKRWRADLLAPSDRLEDGDEQGRLYRQCPVQYMNVYGAGREF